MRMTAIKRLPPHQQRASNVFPINRTRRLLLKGRFGPLFAHFLKARDPSSYLHEARPLKGTALRAAPRWLHPS